MDAISSAPSPAVAAWLARHNATLPVEQAPTPTTTEAGSTPPQPVASPLAMGRGVKVQGISTTGYAPRDPTTASDYATALECILGGLSGDATGYNSYLSDEDPRRIERVRANYGEHGVEVIRSYHASVQKPDIDKMTKWAEDSLRALGFQISGSLFEADADGYLRNGDAAISLRVGDAEVSFDWQNGVRIAVGGGEPTADFPRTQEVMPPAPLETPPPATPETVMATDNVKAVKALVERLGAKRDAYNALAKTITPDKVAELRTQYGDSLAGQMVQDIQRRMSELNFNPRELDEFAQSRGWTVFGGVGEFRPDGTCQRELTIISGRVGDVAFRYDSLDGGFLTVADLTYKVAVGKVASAGSLDPLTALDPGSRADVSA